MNILTRSRKLLSSIMRSDVKLNRQSVFGCVCSQSLCSTSDLSEKSKASCRLRRRVSALNSHFVSNRFYSDRIENTSPRNTGRLEEEAQDPDEENLNYSSVKKNSSEAFSLDVLVSLLRQENATDLVVIKVPENIKYAEYFVVASGISTRHIHAMALYALKVYKFLKKDGDPHVQIEGKDAEDWMCIDFGQIVVHFMLPSTREIYELEKLWTLRAYDEQLQKIPPETLPEDFMLDLEMTK